MAHHGMNHLHGINAMCKKDQHQEGRFGRLFPDSGVLYSPPAALKALGALGGPMDGGNGSNPSATIPLGFVFFGQFIDHDITLDTTSQLDKVNDPNATENFRTPALDLDSIYGAGPDANAFLYKDGVHLLTGADGTGLSGQLPVHSADDLVRNASGTAIIGDPRNDENRLISQLQLAFIRFHNHVVDHLTDSTRLQGKELFDEARRLVTWHYQWIVINEFLPLMIGKPMVNKLLGVGRNFYKPSRAFIPVEFSAAAYRFGHSMAPKKLKVRFDQANPFDLFGSALGIGFSPISHIREIVEWSTMFEIDSLNPAQKTEKLDTKLSRELLELPFIQEGEKSLATRNLLRGQSFLLPSGESVARKMGVAQAAIDAVTDYVQINTPGIDLSNGTPLWYYLLAEAELNGRQDADDNKPGEGLGTVGGTIVGETLIGLIELDSTSFLSVNRNWVPTLSSSGDFSMADLLTFQAVPVTA